MTDVVSISQEAAEALEKANTGMVNDGLVLVRVGGRIRGVLPARGCEDARIVGRAPTFLFAVPRPDSPKSKRLCRDTERTNCNWSG